METERKKRKRTVIICNCGHRKREHRVTITQPNGGCDWCDCAAFTPEPVCRCGHGKKAHTKGPCHEAYLDDCRSFRESPP